MKSSPKKAAKKVAKKTVKQATKPKSQKVTEREFVRIVDIVRSVGKEEQAGFFISATKGSDNSYRATLKLNDVSRAEVFALVLRQLNLSSEEVVMLLALLK